MSSILGSAGRNARFASFLRQLQSESLPRLGSPAGIVRGFGVSAVVPAHSQLSFPSAHRVSSSSWARSLSSTANTGDAASKEGAKQEEPAAKSDASAEAKSGPDPAARIAELEELLKAKTEANQKLTDDNNELKKRALTALADVENMRVRMNIKADEDRKFAVRSFAKGMLEVADILEKALESMSEEKRKVNQELEQVYEGVAATDRIFHKALEAHGIKRFNPDKQKFDPNLHQALFEMPVGEGQEKGFVGAVVKNGYMIHDRCLRPAEVGVFK